MNNKELVSLLKKLRTTKIISVAENGMDGGVMRNYLRITQNSICKTDGLIYYKIKKPDFVDEVFDENHWIKETEFIEKYKNEDNAKLECAKLFTVPDIDEHTFEPKRLVLHINNFDLKLDASSKAKDFSIVVPPSLDFYEIRKDTCDLGFFSSAERGGIGSYIFTNCFVEFCQSPIRSAYTFNKEYIPAIKLLNGSNCTITFFQNVILFESGDLQIYLFNMLMKDKEEQNRKKAV